MEFSYEPGRIFAQDGHGNVIAEVTFASRDGVATIDHTFVDESLRGQGIASKLVRAAADQITADGDKVAASCSYAIAWLERHPEYGAGAWPAVPEGQPDTPPLTPGRAS